MRKIIYLVLGSIASGKSSVSQRICADDDKIEYLCADIYKKKLFDVSVLGETASKVGYRCADELLFYRINELCSSGISFILEFCTTNRNKFETIKYYARLYNYSIITYFVGTDNVSINLARKLNREEEGADYVSDKKIIIRYEDAFNSILEAMCISKKMYFIDNSSDTPYVVALSKNHKIIVYDNDCDWFKIRVRMKILYQKG